MKIATTTKRKAETERTLKKDNEKTLYFFNKLASSVDAIAIPVIHSFTAVHSLTH